MLKIKVQISDLISALLPLSTFATLLNPSPVCSFWQLNATSFFLYKKYFNALEQQCLVRQISAYLDPPAQTRIPHACQNGGE